MKLVLFTIVVAAFAAVECGHRFVGTNVNRTLVYHHNAQYSSRIFQKRIENLYFSLPNLPSSAGRSIQGILAYDLTNSGASANITQGGIGFNFMNLRMKSDRGKDINFNVYVYA